MIKITVEDMKRKKSKSIVLTEGHYDSFIETCWAVKYLLDVKDWSGTRGEKFKNSAESSNPLPDNDQMKGGSS